MPQDILKIIIQAAREATVEKRIKIGIGNRQTDYISMGRFIDADLFIKKLEEYAHEKTS